MVFLTRVSLRNYKSIAACQVELGDLTFLVGPNGSGKSNFLDAVRFVADSVNTSLDHALRDRGTIKEVRRRSGGHPNHFAIRLDFQLPQGGHGHFAFRIGAKPNGGFEVQNEECHLVGGGENLGEARYHVQAGQLISTSAPVAPPVLADRLFLVAASGLPEFRPAYDALSRLAFYNLSPEKIGAMQKPDAGELLDRDGGNSASVFAKLPEPVQARINEYLSRIVPGVSGAEPKTLGSQETLEFRQQIKGAKTPWRFLASSMSDGTLRAFGVLLALFQTLERNGRAPKFVGVEEPEIALHPAASGILLDGLREASEWTQVAVTSHSPDLLDHQNITPDSILAVESVDGVTRLGSLDEAGRSALVQRLFTPGELLRTAQLAPDSQALTELVDERQMKLFEVEDPA
jgi:predicted ATPase